MDISQLRGTRETKECRPASRSRCKPCDPGLGITNQEVTCCIQNVLKCGFVHALQPDDACGEVKGMEGSIEALVDAELFKEYPRRLSTERHQPGPNVDESTPVTRSVEPGKEIGKKVLEMGAKPSLAVA